jgi:hypothetical protein
MGARSFVGQLMGAMKLYSYSSELLTFVEAKWYRARLATLGIVVGTIMFFGFMKLNQAVGITSGSRLAHRLAEENSALRQESILISPRLSKLKIQVKQLSDQDDKLHHLLNHQEIFGDTVTGFTDANQWVKLQPLNPMATSFRP